MKSPEFVRYALLSCAAAAFLAGCGGGQTPIGAPGAMLQSRAIGTHADRSGSLMLPKARKGDLLYVSDDAGHVFQLSYPDGALIRTMNALAIAMCVDKRGDVFMTRFVNPNSDIAEYAHGGTQPIATLSDPGVPMGCSVDPISGDLAVANIPRSSQPGSIEIYQDAQGEPTSYTDPSFEMYAFCSYDNQGNLFVDGMGPEPSNSFRLAELPRGSSSFTDITLNKLGLEAGSVQWDGAYLAIAVAQAKLIYRVQVSGSTGKVIGKTRLRRIKTPKEQFWIQSDRVITANGANGKSVGLWKYPEGGIALESIKGLSEAKMRSFTISRGSQL